MIMFFLFSLVILRGICSNELNSTLWTRYDQWKYDEVSVYQNGIYQEKGVYNKSNIPGGRRDSYFIFGGLGFGVYAEYGDLGDLWQLNVTTFEWRFVRGTAVANWPYSETNNEYYSASNEAGSWLGSQCFISLEEDSFYVFGGYSRFGNYYSKYTYKYNISRNEWKRQPGNSGGYTYGDMYSRTWRPDLTVYPATYPFLCAGVYYPEEKSYLIYGGYGVFPGSDHYKNYGQAFNNFWEFKLDKTSPNYEKIRHLHGFHGSTNLANVGELGEFSTSYYSKAVSQASMWVYGSYVYVFGGVNVRTEDTLYALHFDSDKLAWIGGHNPSNEHPSSIGELVSFDDFHKDNQAGGTTAAGTWLGKDPETIVLFGGSYTNRGYTYHDFTSNVWVYSCKRNMWKSQRGMLTPYDERMTNWNIGGRESPHVLFNPRSDESYSEGESKERVMLFSGEGLMFDDGGAPFRDMWFYNNYLYYECSGHGEFYYYEGNIFTHEDPASAYENCTCEENYYGSRCQNWSCFGVSRYNTTQVCHGHGECSYFDFCECSTHYYGVNCSSWSCFGVERDNISHVCSNHGVCGSYQNCECIPPYYGSDCSDFECFGKSWSDLGVCSGHGNCVSPDKCLCDDYSFYQGESCEIFECFGYNSTNDSVCGGELHGKCSDLDDCECYHSGYLTSDCTYYKCFEIECNDSSSVCSGNGECTRPDKCVCDDAHTGEKCEDNVVDVYECFGVIHSLNSTCRGRGSCQSTDTCDCFNGNNYHGSECQELIGKGMLYEESDTLSFEFEVEMSIIQDLGEVFDCVEIFPTEVANFGDNPVCSWIFSMRMTRELQVSLGKGYNKLALSSEVKLRPVTKNVEVSSPVETVKKLTESSNSKSSSSNSGLYALFSLLLLVNPLNLLIFLPCCVCCCTCWSCCCCCLGSVLFIYRNYSARQKKLKTLKFKDILMSEQKVMDELRKEKGASGGLQISKEIFRIDINDIVLISQIGKGGSSTVYKSKWKNKTAAFKLFDTSKVVDLNSLVEDFEHEINIMASLSHPYIINFYGCVVKLPRIGILTEFCENGDLRSYLSKNNPGAFTLNEKFKRIVDIALCLEYIHERNVIHRDLKLENILMTHSLEIRLIDFGLSKVLVREDGIMSRKKGTSHYMAPELVLGGKFTFKIDTYSFSMIMYELLTENLFPFGRDLDFCIELKVANNPSFRPVFEQEFIESFKGAEKFIDIIKLSWDAEASKRPTFKEIRMEANSLLGELISK